MNVTIIHNPYFDDGLETMWRFSGMPQSFADHFFKYVIAYTNQFRDERGSLPPMRALSDWDPKRYGWCILSQGVIAITLIGDKWDFDITLQNVNEDQSTQWIDVLYILKKVATMDIK